MRRPGGVFSILLVVSLGLIVMYFIFLQLSETSQKAIVVLDSDKRNETAKVVLENDKRNDTAKVELKNDKGNDTANFSTLIDLKDFKFIMFNNICDTSDVRLISLIHTAPSHFVQRQTIRETWGQPFKGTKLGFMLGVTTDVVVQKKIDEENMKHHDLIQGNFMDSYKNMTYKFVMLLKFAQYYCPQANYIVKADDDAFINILDVLDWMSAIPKTYPIKNLIMCNLMDGSPIIRQKSKWHVSWEEWPTSDAAYPAYCSGYSIILSLDVAKKLHDVSHLEKYFWVDDVHVLGTLRRRANLTDITWSTPYILGGRRLELITAPNGTHVFPKFFFTRANLGPDRIRQIWKLVMEQKKLVERER